MDLGPCYFLLFPSPETKTEGVTYGSPEEAGCVFEKLFLGVPAEDYSNFFDSWFHRVKLCIKSNGEYFEKI